jgi:hypothetical protein
VTAAAFAVALVALVALVVALSVAGVCCPRRHVEPATTARHRRGAAYGPLVGDVRPAPRSAQERWLFGERDERNDEGGER